MLGKLIKYDLKSSAKLFTLIHAVFLLVCGAGRLFYMDRLDFHAPAETLVAPITIISAVGVFLVSAITLCTSLLITFRFYRNLFSREGYLSWTLPVSGIEHLWAKIISGYLLSVIDVIVVFAGILILVTGRNVTEAYRLIAPEMTEVLGMSLGTFALYIFISSLIGCIGAVLMIYFSICVGQLFPGHRVLCAIAVYFITSFVVQIITFVIMTVFGLFDFSSTGTGAVADDILNMLIPNTVFALILAVIQYAAAHYIMKKKINLI